MLVGLKGSAALPAGLRVILGYKIAKALVEIVGGASIFILGSVGLATELARLAELIRHHATEAWSIALAEKLLDVSTAHNVLVVATAMSADGVLTSIEGWALYRQYSWSRWLVLATTAALIPFEVMALARHPTVGRSIVLGVNSLIVMYLYYHPTKHNGL